MGSDGHLVASSSSQPGSSARAIFNMRRKQRGAKEHGGNGREIKGGSDGGGETFDDGGA
jgi:hypothetical protein